MHETELLLSIAGLPPMSGQGCKQTLIPIKGGQLSRDINGQLISLGSEVSKFRSIITGQGLNAIATESLWVGTQLQIGCIQMIWAVIEKGNDEVNLSRPAVEGSVIAVDLSGERVDIENIDGTLIKLSKPASDKIFIGFRPWMTVQVVNFILKTDEWENICNWKLIVEEV